MQKRYLVRVECLEVLQDDEGRRFTRHVEGLAGEYLAPVVLDVAGWATGEVRRVFRTMAPELAGALAADAGAEIAAVEAMLSNPEKTT
jgi:hypothetical protein